MVAGVRSQDDLARLPATSPKMKAVWLPLGGVRHAFHLRRADGRQLQRISELVDSGALRTVIDRTFAFEDTPDALAYVASGRAKGKVVVTVP